MSSPFANAAPKASPGAAGGKYKEFDEENAETVTRPTTDKKDLEATAAVEVDTKEE